jgi:mercuric ion transport protein
MKTVSKSGTWLATAAGVACVACCALPILITAGVLGGGAVAFLAANLPVVAIALAVPAVAAFALAARRRARARPCSCDAQGGCGCDPTRA